MAQAQMFSVENGRHTENIIPHFRIYAGVGPTHFSYRTDDNAGVYSFDGEVANLVLEAYNFKLFFAKGIGLGHISYFETGIQGGYKLPVYQSREIILLVPLQLQAGITTVTNDNQVLLLNAPSFREGSISVRTGAALQARFSPAFRLGAGVIPNFGITYSAGRYNGGGTVLGAEGNIRFYFDHLFGKAGLSLGYSYNFRKFNVKGSLFDYNAVENSFLIGITF